MGIASDEQPTFCRLARVRVFDGNYQVLYDHNFSVPDVDVTDRKRLDDITIYYAGLAREVENEPMSHPRIELICTHTSTVIAVHSLRRFGQ